MTTERTSRPLAKIFNAIGAVLFALFAWLQREDDNVEIYVNPSKIDVALWIGFYGLVAALFVLAIFRRFPRWLYLAVLALGVFHLVTTIPGVIDNFKGGSIEMAKESMSAERPEVELSREFFGVLVAFVGAWLAWRQRPKAAQAD